MHQLTLITAIVVALIACPESLSRQMPLRLAFYSLLQSETSPRRTQTLPAALTLSSPLPALEPDRPQRAARGSVKRWSAPLVWHCAYICHYSDVVKLIVELIILSVAPAGAPGEAGIQPESEEQRKQSENINCPSDKLVMSDQPSNSDSLMTGEKEGITPR